MTPTLAQAYAAHAAADRAKLASLAIAYELAEAAFRKAVRHNVRLWTAANETFDALASHARSMGWSPGVHEPNPLMDWVEATLAGEQSEQQRGAA